MCRNASASGSVAEGFGFHMAKGYLYAAIGFSILIEAFNQISSRNRRRALDQIPLRQRAADGIYRLLTPRTKLDGDAATLGAATDEAQQDETAAFQPADREIIHGVIALADLPVGAIMTSRSEIFWLDSDAPAADNLNRLIESGRTRTLIAQGEIDQLVGVAETRALLPSLMRGDAGMAALAERPLVVPDAISALRLIDIFRETSERFAVVVDDRGNIAGIVTTTDVFAAIAGDLAEDEDIAGWQQDGEQAIIADDAIALPEAMEALGHAQRPGAGRYGTLGGYLLFEFGRMPSVGEVLEHEGVKA